jgi:glycosyltransferase involved in cell wall biosynthesis
MKKVAIDCRMINSSGIGTYLQNNVAGLVDHFEVIALGSSDELKKFDWYKSVRVLEFNAPIYSLKEQLMYPILIPRCEVLWSPHFNVPLLPTRAKKRVVTIHDVFHLHYYSSLSLFQKIYASIVFRFAVALSNKIITVSKFSQQELLKYLKFSTDKIKVIYNAIEPKVFHKTADASGNLMLSELGIVKDRYILCVGNIKSHKNIKVVLETIKQNLISADIKLVLVGKIDGLITSDNQLLQEIARSPQLKERIIFTNYIETNDLIRLYSSAMIFIFPSLYEGFGIPPLEAMACECPVIASDIPVVREICGDAVLYFNPTEPNDLAFKIQQLMNDESLRKHMITIGIKRVSQFTWLESVQSHLSVFARL